MREDELVETVLQKTGTNDLPRLYYYLQRLAQVGILLRSAQLEGTRLATLMPTSATFVINDRRISPELRYSLSRFAYMRRLDHELVVESPLAHARLILHDWRAVAVAHFLAQACSPEDISHQVPRLTSEVVNQLLMLLVGAGLADEVNENNATTEDEHPALQVWEFHDMLFHARSRAGRHDNPVGATYRFVGQLDPPPALKSARVGAAVELFRPDLELLQRDDLPYAHVQEIRRSLRTYGEHPINAKQLGEFLFRVGRVKSHTEFDVATPSGSIRMDFVSRPYPAGGALYELELYVVVNSCGDLDAGMYHYDSQAHRLVHVAGRTPEVELLLRSASGATTIPRENLQVLIIVAARFQRMAWKYSSMAYSAILKHVGVLYQTMYLAATAMGLAPCGVGCGDSDAFSRAAETDYYTETSVGEFLLGSRSNVT